MVILVVMVVNLLIIGFINGEWNVWEIVSWWICCLLVCSWLVIVVMVFCVFEIISDVGLLIVVMLILVFSSGCIFFLVVCMVIIVLLVGNVCMSWLWVVINIVVFFNDRILVICVVDNLLIEWFMIKFGCIF